MPVSVASSVDVAWTRIVPVPGSCAVASVARRSCRSSVPAPASTAVTRWTVPETTSVPSPASSALKSAPVTPSTVTVPAPPSSTPSSDGTETATCIGAFVVKLPVLSMTRRPARTTVVTRPTRLSSPVTATDCGVPTWITTVFAPASSTLVNGATSRWSVTETPEPPVDEADGASRAPAVAIATIRPRRPRRARRRRPAARHSDPVRTSGGHQFDGSAPSTNLPRATSGSSRAPLTARAERPFTERIEPCLPKWRPPWTCTP